MAAPDAPFGTHAPTPWQARVLENAARLRPGPLAKMLRSLHFRLAGGKQRGAVFDISPFPGQRARVHPADNNISEKRAFCAPQLWDPEERARLAEVIATGREEFVFVDAGANAGFYSLFARSAAQAARRPIRILAIEPAPDVRGRLRFNLAASGAEEVQVLDYAITDRNGPVNLDLGQRNLGESRIGEGGGLSVKGRTLPAILAEAGVTRVDALKIDIEGHERPALEALFRDAPRALWPRLILMEVSHDADGAYALCLKKGYHPELKTRMNAVLRLDPVRDEG